MLFTLQHILGIDLPPIELGSTRDMRHVCVLPGGFAASDGSRIDLFEAMISSEQAAIWRTVKGKLKGEYPNLKYHRSLHFGRLTGKKIMEVKTF